MLIALDLNETGQRQSPPHTLYHYPNPDTPSWGFPLDRDTHRDLTSLVQGYDLHEYLEPDTMRWCEAYLQRVGISTPLLSTDFIPRLGYYDVPDWFRDFIIAARQHEHEGLLPRLAVAPHPHGAWGWYPRHEVEEELYEGREEYEAHQRYVIRDSQGPEAIIMASKSDKFCRKS